MGAAWICRCCRLQQLPSRRDEDPICAGGGGKGCKHFPWENNPNTPPPTISRATFLVKASIFSPLAQHKILFHPLLVPMPAGPARQQKYRFLWIWPLHAECQVLLESKTLCCLESSGRNGPLCVGSRFALPCLQHLPFPRVPQGWGATTMGKIHPKPKQAQQLNPKCWLRLEMGFKAIAGKPQSGVAIPVPTSLIWLSGFLGCAHIASLIMITLLLVICLVHVEPRLETAWLQSASCLSPPASLPPAS